MKLNNKSGNTSARVNSKSRMLMLKKAERLPQDGGIDADPKKELLSEP